MYNCYNCNITLNETNKSEEHIIPNSLGGQIKSYNLLCQKCNSYYGETIDRELHEQTGLFSDLLNVKRDRPNQNIKVELKAKSGESHYYGPNLSPFSKLYFTPPGKTKPIVLFARNRDEMLKLVEKKKKELESKNYINFSLKEFTEYPEGEVKYFSNKLSKEVGTVGFGNKDFFRALCKIAVNYCLYCGVDTSLVTNAITFIKGEHTINYISRFYYPSHYKIHSLGSDEVSHLLYLVGDYKNQVLYCYIELFNVHNVIVLLNNEYNGPEFEKTYCYDLINSREVLEKKVIIRLHRLHFLDLLKLTSNDNALYEHDMRLKRLNKIIEQRQAAYKKT
ncbi:HNH endonuclease [Rhodocytophaga rosea]|uniref:HNH endonuclease n=1 Tax=Rhodocytophaga rosea TaxID=2704465 RepID=A0A6C0GIA3_9BACT|nr:HNH endonuclease [Rhodocytophaga rosea]QHT67412.1 HNH endonuclease [Rhodocytophaga rosea]